MQPSSQLVLVRIADIEYEQAIEYYRNLGAHVLLRRFVKEIRETIDRIRKYPGACSVRYDNIRVAHTATFNYSIYYSVDDNGTVYIHHILHGSRQVPE